MKLSYRISSIFVIIALLMTPQSLIAYAAVYDDATDIKYSIESSKVLDFDEDDFDNACIKLTKADLDYIKFKLPDEDEGILYYNYDKKKDDNTKVSSARKYALGGSPYLSRVSFVPDKNFSGTVSIRYTGYNEDGDSYSGKVRISVKGSSSSSDITYSVSYKQDYIRFDKNDFFDACHQIQEEDLDYVKFTLPSKSSGILYYDYKASNDENTTVSESKKYYYDSSLYLSKVYFLADKDFSGNLTIKYTGYDIEGDSYTGKIKISVGEIDEDSSSDQISYKAASSTEVIKFDEEDFIDLCDDTNDEDLDYIQFTIPSASKGTLYYNYKDGQYSSTVTSGKKYYADSSPYLGDVTFVPDSKFSGSLKISFEGKDMRGGSFSGDILITVGSSSASANATAINYTGAPNIAVLMKDSDFNSVCRDILGSQLSYITFELPSSSDGTLYYGYSQEGNYSSKVRSGTKYYYDGAPYLLNVSFVPSKEFSSKVSISYTGYDVSGLSFNGMVQINASGGTPATNNNTPVDTSNLISSKYFRDVDTSYSWAVPYIDSLYEDGIISGTSTGSSKLYSPAASVSRGDFMLILYRAMNLKTSSTANKFSDVASSSYYYDAIMTARALSIAQGSDNLFYPNQAITREDAMVFVLRAVNITSKTIPSGDTSALSGYADGNYISDYSKSAIAALIRSGIITGSDDNRIYPQGNLTRAQVAAIIHRVKNLN